jgi:hypothetical protein
MGVSRHKYWHLLTLVFMTFELENTLNFLVKSVWLLSSTLGSQQGSLISHCKCDEFLTHIARRKRRNWTRATTIDLLHAQICYLIGLMIVFLVSYIILSTFYTTFRFNDGRWRWGWNRWFGSSPPHFQCWVSVSILLWCVWIGYKQHWMGREIKMFVIICIHRPVILNRKCPNNFWELL